jgi:hypothetical protein
MFTICGGGGSDPLYKCNNEEKSCHQEMKLKENHDKIREWRFSDRG